MNGAQILEAIIRGASAGLVASVVLAAAGYGCLRWLIRVERKSWSEE